MKTTPGMVKVSGSLNFETSFNSKTETEWGEYGLVRDSKRLRTKSYRECK